MDPKSPQLENGYTKIANELLEALVTFRIPGEQMQCFLAIIRKTYGHGKLEDRISNSQLCKATGLFKSNVSRAMSALIEKQLVIKTDNKINVVIKNDNKCKKTIPSYRINKDYSKWRQLSKTITGVIKNDNKTLSKMMDTKERKKLLQKRKTKRAIFVDFKRPEFITEEQWQVILKTRQAKKVLNTAPALKPFVNQLELAVKEGFELDTCIEEYATSKWTRFKAAWMPEDLKQKKTAKDDNRHYCPECNYIMEWVPEEKIYRCIMMQEIKPGVWEHDF